MPQVKIPRYARNDKIPDFSSQVYLDFIAQSPKHEERSGNMQIIVDPYQHAMVNLNLSHKV
ncbi:MAG: hypothetical protein HQM11_10055 [SAR324 cluster bacterium]|nr:hypothetical protein [SAR324 cluster bacterium]